MIHFVSGKPGGGKSLFGMRLILDELVKGSRQIITNLAVRLPELNEYFQRVYPEAFERRMAGGRHISEIVHVLSDDDLPKFFTLRGDGVRVNSVTNDEWRGGKRPDFSAVKDGGIFYVLDEIHIAFNARAWATTGQEVLYYLSQHRKLGDDVVCITQSIGNVDKQFRSVAQDFTYIKNLSKQRAGLFRLPSVFIRQTYPQPKTDTSKAMESGTFTLDVSGLASCYDTAKGVGIIGRSGADTSERKKGLHWGWFAVGLPLVLWLIFHWGPIVLVRLMQPAGAHPGHTTSGAVEKTPLSQPAAKAGAENQPERVKPAKQAESDLGPEAVTNADEVVCTGYMLTPGGVTVFLSDGRTAESADGDVEYVHRHQVKVFGREYEIKPKYPVLEPKAPAVVEPGPVGGADSGAGVVPGAKRADSVTFR